MSDPLPLPVQDKIIVPGAIFMRLKAGDPVVLGPLRYRVERMDIDGAVVHLGPDD